MIKLERGGHVVFLCAANIIRSPMAAAIFTYKMKARGFDCFVESAGVMKMGYSTGAASLWKQVPMAERFDLSSHRSRHISEVSYKATTFFACAGSNVVDQALKLERVDPGRVLILNGRHGGIADPVHDPTVQGFKDCFTQIYTSIDKFVKEIVER